MNDKTTEELFDSIPEEFDPNAPIPNAEDIKNLEKEWSPIFDVFPGPPGYPYPEVDSFLDDAPGVYAYYSKELRYGLEQTISAIHEVGKIWALRYPDRRFGIGDISQKGGGPIHGHASHQKGIDFDVRLLRNDWAESATKYQDHNYSLHLTQELIDLFWTNSKLAVQYIFFNDNKTKGTRPWPNHDNHLHIRFFKPGSGSAPPILERNNDKQAANNELQRCLNKWQMRTQFPGEPLNIDGVFGEKTFECLKKFQNTLGVVPVDGVTRENTWTALQNWRS